MDLCVFAHRGEAQSFLKGLKSTDQKFYQGTSYDVLITGEGPYEATKLGAFAKNYQRVLNFGIAGSLSAKIETNSIHKIRTFYLYEYDSPQFKSFTSNGSFDCITSYKRVLDDEMAKTLQNFAPIVDREAWMYAKVCSDLNIPFESYKLISDQAGSETECFDLKLRAQEFSDSLYYYYQNQISDLESTPPIPELPGSFTQQKRLHKLIQAIAAKETTSLEELLIELDIPQTKNELTDYIDQLENRLNPFFGKLKQRTAKIQKPFQDIGAQLLFDPKFEKKSIRLAMEINHQTNINNLLRALRELEFKSIEDIWDGNV